MALFPFFIVGIRWAGPDMVVDTGRGMVDATSRDEAAGKAARVMDILMPGPYYAFRESFAWTTADVVDPDRVVRPDFGARR
jgi:hypothetical protein